MCEARVKKLVWEAIDSDWDDFWHAKTTVGNYSVIDYTSHVAFLGPDFKAIAVKGVDAAKAAAQDDFERRVLACLDLGVKQ